MTLASTAHKLSSFTAKAVNLKQLLPAFFAGLLLPLGFAPFHLPGAVILGFALFYVQLQRCSSRNAFSNGMFFGLGYFGLGVSWVFVSIHEYGHLNNILSAFITLLFLLYLSLFTATMAFVFRKITSKSSPLLSCLLFSALWILFEYLRSTALSGFPWLLVGFGQFDTPGKYLLPVIGVFGLGFLTCFAATILAEGTQHRGLKRVLWLSVFVGIIISPLLLKDKNWSIEGHKPISVGVIQANLSMRDKWDEHLFWQLLERYQQEAERLLGTDLIVMPESAIPLPASYIQEFIETLHNKAEKSGSAILLGIPEPTPEEESSYFNTMKSLGVAEGTYIKQHLVPFGEYMPKPFQYLSDRLAIPDANLTAGGKNQDLIRVADHPIASLICYELAYGNLLRQQLPQAEWIVSISDDGWFGHSLAVYQQLQMAQVLSLETARYQVVANNDGLSSIINPRGIITASLPAFSSGILQAKIFPASGITPWIYWGDLPVLLFCILIVLIYTGFRIINHKLNH